MDTDDLHIALIRISQSEEDVSATTNPMSTFKEPLDSATEVESATPKVQNNYLNMVTPAPFRPPIVPDTQFDSTLSQDSEEQVFQGSSYGPDYAELQAGASSFDDWESDDEVHSTEL